MKEKKNIYLVFYFERCKGSVFFISCFLLMVYFFLINTNSRAFAQTNLIINPSFEKVDSKPKEVGELYKAKPWISPTEGTADVFSKKAKSDQITVPVNALGEQTPRTGVNYAGAIFFSKKTNSTREYIQTEFSKPLEVGKVYCVEFYVSLADLCKYGIDRIGAYISVERIGSKNWDPLSFVPQIANFQNRILSEQNQWQVICGEYTSLGGENFITIGNFFLNEQTKIKRLKKPKEIKGAQNDYGYYYIDDVSVYESNDRAGCGCEKKLAIKKVESGMEIVYSKVSGDNEEKLVAEEIIETKNILFEEGKSEIQALYKSDIELLIKLMKDNPHLKIEITGYADINEVKKTLGIASDRANIIAQAFYTSGIKKDRVLVIKSDPVELKDSANEAFKRQSRKVDFSVIVD